MATIMAQTKTRVVTGQDPWGVAFIVLPCMLLPFSLTAADVKVTPLLKTSFYGYQIKTEQTASTDDGAAWEISPGLVFNRQSAHVKTQLTWQNDSVLYKDTQRENESFNVLSFTNTVTAFKERLSWQINAQQDYLVRDTRRGIFSDNVTGAENLSKANSYGTEVRYRNTPTAVYITDVGLQYRKSESSAVFAEESFDRFTDFNNDAYTANLSFGTNNRGLNFFWLVQADVQEVQRDNSADISSNRYNLAVGIPFAPNFSIFSRMGTERVDNGAIYDNTFDYFGGGVEYRFGAKSRINLTMNRSDSKAFDEESETDTYVASDFLLALSRRTSLEGAFDRRFFGRSMQLSGKYDLRFLSIRLSVSENVRTQNLFDNELADLGLFVCPDGSNNLDACFRPPSNQYVPVFGESLQQVSVTNSELRQELVKVRSETLNIAYSKNRLSLNLALSDIETEYVESGDINTNKNASVQASWQLNQKSKVLTDLTYYQTAYFVDEREDKNMSASVSFSQELNKQSTATLTLRRLDRNSNIGEFDNSENRVWLQYTYRF